jgi:RNA polymerase I-specific transcription initiation factor RRN3
MNSSTLTWNAAIASSSAAIADLQAFFPFDPYRLPKSSRWFDGMYRDWNMVAIGDDDEEDGEEEDDESDEEDAVVASVATQVGGMREMTAETEESDAERETTDDEELYGVPMELGSVREERIVRSQLGVSESFGKMSISPVQGALHRHVGGRRGP